MSTSTYSNGEQVGSLAIVVAVAAGAGIAVGLLFGFTFPPLGKFKGYRLEPVIKKVQVPSLIVMIILGCIARNLFGKVMDAYPTLWTSYIRSICLSILLIRGGLQVTFQGKGLIVAFLAFVPQIFEAVTIALIAYGLFDMPMSLCFAMAFTISCISPSVMVPGLINLSDKGYGKEKGIISSLIAAGTFDDIICIICFGICKTIAYNDGKMSSDKTLEVAIYVLILENIAGLVVGFIMAMVGNIFRLFPKTWVTMHLKMWYCIACAIAFVIAGEQSKWTNSKYIASLTFGYCSYRVWGEDKPTRELGWFWWFITPLFFGSVGAALLFKTIRNSDIGYGVICIICGLIIRLIVVIILAQFPRGQLNNREKAFMAFAWLPKATVQAALSAVILNDAKKQKNVEMEHYGNIIQTVSIFSIVICAPIGAVLISTFGPLFLSQSKKQEETIQIEDDDKQIEMKDMEIEVETSKKKDQSIGPGEYSRKLEETVGGIDIADEDNQENMNTYSSPMKLKMEF
ncbi:mitochondrial sodium hydrogen exchanger nha2 [Stylonychia lemnae]|uniref:Mitochondrial sodium hydrogen exchanger nha2 n=1 Tax=Stylonychia lemnae TaxID=5949 RepID=A0A078B5I1_STYLE|nr:mitochondrial sodium hydrogen exchanger nha2 [Stylonychia lemnae]|eukprot:CDW89456.1 mitochondrial sodium hydrogen exchanger nha2 [Stylonychia lemnae]